MAKEGLGRIIVRETKTKNKKYKKTWIYIPSQVANDTAFPFKHREEVIVKIDIHGKRLIIEKKK